MIYQISFKSIESFVGLLAQKFLFFSDTNETLNQGQGPLDWYRNVEYTSICHHTRFETNLRKGEQCQSFPASI